MIQVQSCKYNLKFRFEAGTSRGVMHDRDTWFVIIRDRENGITGIGECAPLRGLSLDYGPGFQTLLEKFCSRIELFINENGVSEKAVGQVPLVFPSIRMGMETAVLDYLNGGKRQIFHNGFFQGTVRLPVNGLIWMGKRGFMREQIRNKIAAGYTCIKIKIGAIGFDDELSLISEIRDNFGSDEITIRVDANGAFTPQEVFGKLDKLYKFGIHSIEQPVKPEHRQALADLCKNSPVPVALDESLIGQSDYKEELLDTINPAYVIIKPTLLGGFVESAEWIGMAEKRKIGWWITSALESNIGLNAICQFTAGYAVTLTQGLGTGKLYHNNIPSPLIVEKGFISSPENLRWDTGPVLSLSD